MFYDLPKEERDNIIKRIKEDISKDLKSWKFMNIRQHASDNDTYIRRQVYLILGRFYKSDENLRDTILKVLKYLFQDSEEKVRQTVVYALGEIGKIDADKILAMFEEAIMDESGIVKNAVVGALKQIGNKNPSPVLNFAERFLQHPDADIRKGIIHGIELRGRKHPEEILPYLARMQNDANIEVQKKVVHVLGQISYKEGCLEKVLSSLKGWENKELVEDALYYILAVHQRYRNFSALSPRKAKKLIKENFDIKI